MPRSGSVQEMISLIVPIYNTEQYLRQCIDSILKQTYRDLEILLIDDGSSDESGKICDEYGRIDPRIRVFHTENNGLSSARNLGLREAKGDYIGFVDSDDWLDPDMYYDLLQNLGITSDISACGVRREYLRSYYDYSTYNTVFSRQSAIQALTCGFSTAVWNKLYKKTCWEGILFPEQCTYEDVLVIYKVFLNSNSVSCTPKSLYHYRARIGSITNTRTIKNLRDFWRAYHIRYIFLSTLPEFRDNQEFINMIEKDIAKAAVQVWLQTYYIPKRERDYSFLYKVTLFVRKKYPLFGKAWWSKSLRISIFFTRYANDFSIACLYTLKRFYRLIIPSSFSLYP